MTSGLLATSTEAQPLKAPSPMRAGKAVDHDERAVEAHLGLGGERRAQQAGRVDRELDGNDLPLGRLRRKRGVDAEFQRCAVGARGARQPEYVIGAEGGIDVDAFDPALDAVAYIGGNDRAFDDFHAIDADRLGLGCGFRRARRAVEGALAQQLPVQHGLGDHEFGDMRMARPKARQGHIGLQAADGHAPCGIAVLRVLQRDAAQADIQRRPHADLGRSGNGQPVAGLLLDTVLDRRGEEARGDPDDEQQRQHDDDCGYGGAGDFQCFHVTFPASGFTRPSVPSAGP